MVSDDDKTLGPLQVDFAFLNGPYNGQKLNLTNSVIGFRITYKSRSTLDELPVRTIPSMILEKSKPEALEA